MVAFSHSSPVTDEGEPVAKEGENGGPTTRVRGRNRTFKIFRWARLPTFSYKCTHQHGPRTGSLQEHSPMWISHWFPLKPPTQTQVKDAASMLRHDPPFRQGGEHTAAAAQRRACTAELSQSHSEVQLCWTARVFG